MKITKEQLKRIIKEELENIMTEEEVDDASEAGRPKQWYDEPMTIYDGYFKYQARRAERAKNHKNPKIRELANSGDEEQLEQALHLVDSIDGELKLLPGEEKEFTGWGK